MWECVYREGEKARSTVQEDAGTREEIQGGDAEAGENREAGSAGSRGNPWDHDWVKTIWHRFMGGGVFYSHWANQREWKHLRWQPRTLSQCAPTVCLGLVDRWG